MYFHLRVQKMGTENADKSREGGMGLATVTFYYLYLNEKSGNETFHCIWVLYYTGIAVILTFVQMHKILS